MKKIFLVLGTGLLLAGGCVFFQNGYVEPLDYDLTPSKPEPAANVGLLFGVIRDFSGSDRRILVRQADGTVRRDEYRRWAVDPALLIQRFLYESLHGEKTSLPVIRLTGELYRFEYVAAPAAARFLAGFTLRHNEVSREIKCDYTVPIDEKTTPIKAMEECLARAAEEIRQTASEMVKKGAEK